MVAEVNTYAVHVSREGGKYWHIHIPDVDRVTQARSVDEIDVMARDLVAIMLGVAPDSFDLDLRLELPGFAAHMERARQLRERELEIRNEAAGEWRAAAIALRDAGVPLRDLGKLLGVSYQRAHQLVSS